MIDLRHTTTFASVIPKKDGQAGLHPSSFGMTPTYQGDSVAFKDYIVGSPDTLLIR